MTRRAIRSAVGRSAAKVRCEIAEADLSTVQIGGFGAPFPRFKKTKCAQGVRRPPVGLQPFADGRLMAVANSNRFTTAPGSVSIIDTGCALTHQPATLKTFDVGVFPRQWALGADGKLLLLTEFGSSRLDVFDVPALLQGGHEGD
jgi:hypothetical protein